jgi:uncharacterized protein (DUF885 family)
LLAAAGAALASGLPAAAQAQAARPIPDQARSRADQADGPAGRGEPGAGAASGDVAGSRRRARAALRGRIEDRSLEGQARDDAADAKALAELRAIDRAKLNAADRISYDTIEFQLAGRQSLAKFPYGGTYTVYTLAQRSGAYTSVPDFLDTQHPLKTEADGEAYLSRLDGYATAIDQDTERFMAEVAAKAVPPAYILDTTASQLKRQAGAAPVEAGVVRGLARRAGEARLSPRLVARAAELFSGKVRPALQRQITAVERVRATATTDAGVWKLPDGEAYYAAKLKWFTTTDMTAEEVHQLGLTQVAELTSQLDRALRSQGYTTGTVLQRLQAINVDPAQTYPNTDPGRAELIASLNAQIVDLDARLPRAFNRLPRAKVEVRRVPPETQDGAANGYYQSASLDGSRPGAYYINLKDTTEWPKWSLPTLTYHEANPGHHFQNTIALEDPSIPLYRRAFVGFSAYGEGWGLYAEQVADELGMYDACPLGRVGLYQSYLFRAARLAVDTGLHHKRWTREQANAWMLNATGDPPGQVAREIDRYITNPGQACSYKIGQTTILRLREAARRTLGERFDVKAFHDVVLGTNDVPLTVLERVVNEWVASLA